VEIRHLRCFVAVAEELSFTRAAQRLHVGQPPLSQTIQSLEEELGVCLLERSRRWVRLTEAGKLFLNDARHMLSLAASAARTAQRAANGELGELRIGLNASTPLSPAFAATIDAYRKRYPHVSLQFAEMSTMQQLEHIADRRLDVGFIRDPHLPPSKLSFHPIALHSLKVVLRADHPLALRTSIALSELRTEPFVMFRSDSGTTIYPQIQQICRSAGFEPRVALEVSEATMIIGLVAAGCGVSILPDIFACIHVPNIRHVQIRQPSASAALVLACRTTDISPLVQAFAETAIRAGGTAGGAGKKV
jgi:DNA-binding transcriptional LysR family regulator